MKTTLFKSLPVAIILMMGYAACNDGILDTGIYNGNLPAVNFSIPKISIDETAENVTPIEMQVFGGPVIESGSVQVKINPAAGVKYGVDFTTQPPAIDGFIEIVIPKGDDKATFGISTVNDLESISDKSVTFNLCNGTGGVQVGGKYFTNVTIVNKNLTASWLTIIPNLNSLPDFGEVNKGDESSPKSFLLQCNGLRDDITITAPVSFKLSLEENGNYSNVLYIEKEAFANNTEVSIWAKFMPLSGLDGIKEGQISIKTFGTSGYFVSVSGKETGNKGPYIFVLAPKADGFWNTKGNVGNKAAMDLKPNDIFGDLYYRFDLTKFNKPVAETGKIYFNIKAKTSAAGCKISLYQLDPWTAQQTTRPERGDVIPTLENLEIDFLAETWHQIDVTQYVTSMLSNNNKMLYFGIMMSEGTAVQIYGANSSTNFTNNANLVINDRD